MKESSKYTKIVSWSDIDQCYIGSAPDLISGGCHGDNEREVFDHLCQIVEEVIDLYKADGKKLPPVATVPYHAATTTKDNRFLGLCVSE